ncbi:unnamed protein product [Clavelina lepadiformis]|uniref:Fucosyltransferase n=2 Tax=Clavelina lepadiformis TaxID=159417 RepID=A0ABP0F440_CLALP
MFRRRLKSYLVIPAMLVVYLCIIMKYDTVIFEWIHIKRSYLLAYLHVDRELAKTMYHFPRRISKELKNKKIILIWSPELGKMEKNPLLCPGCILTYDQRTISDADAVIFPWAETWDSADKMPSRYRSPKQRWVWYCQEPPWVLRYVFLKTLTPLNGIFNWTMTYRTDSDIPGTFFVPYKYHGESVAEIIAKKNKDVLGAWVVSNCATTSRKEFIASLSRHIKIDVFGKCVGKTLCKDKECQRRTLSRYKFYFALENSQCKDYITEKFWTNALGSLAVPVVMGPSRQEYELVAPPGSFIHVDDFDSAETLANFLKNLDKDDKSYGEYLRWAMVAEKEGAKAKVYGPVMNKKLNGASSICALCEKLKHEPPNKTEVVKNLDKWWFGDDYDPNVDNFSVCQSKIPSGRPTRLQTVLIYTFVLWFTLGVLWFCYHRRTRKQ